MSGNPLSVTLYESMDLTPATIAALQLSAPGTVAVSLFDADTLNLGFERPASAVLHASGVQAQAFALA